MQFNTRQSFPRGVLTEDVLEVDSESSSEDEGIGEVGDVAGGSEGIIQDSFQERMKNWDELEVVSTVAGIYGCTMQYFMEQERVTGDLEG